MDIGQVLTETRVMAVWNHQYQNKTHCFMSGLGVALSQHCLPFHIRLNLDDIVHDSSLTLPRLSLSRLYTSELQSLESESLEKARLTWFFIYEKGINYKEV